MSVTARKPWNKARRPRRAARLHVESLEDRSLPAAWPGLVAPVDEAGPNDVLGQAQGLGDLTAASRGEAVGAVGNEATGAADVDWYTFTLTTAARVNVSTLARLGGSPLTSVLSLYNSDPADPLGHRLLARQGGAALGGDAALERLLGPGTYFVAVSGSGNADFHPFLADSGLPGSTGGYGLLVTAADLGAAPQVLAVDPAPGAVLPGSPLVVRVSLSAPLAAGQTLTVRDASDSAVALSAFDFSGAINEARLFLARPLAEGSYRVSLRDGGGNELFGSAFTVAGAEGAAGRGTAGNDTAATAVELGDVANAFTRRAGVVGDDPFYDPASPDPLRNNFAADVDLYHFTVTGPGNYALIAEASAGRVGSPLDPALSLYRRNAGTGLLELVDLNDSTLNDSVAANFTVPLFTDAVLYSGLTAGDYYVAVSSSGNLPDPLLGVAPGTNGVFDPNVSHSGSNGDPTRVGPYVLNLVVYADNTAPEVTAVSVAEGDVLAAPPTGFTVRFGEAVNLQQLVYLAGQQTGSGRIDAVRLVGPNGVSYYPRLLSYDLASNEATFLVLDALPNGASELRLSGAFGLADYAGNRLAGNDASGDYVVRFAVNGPPRGSAGNPLLWRDQEPNNTFATAQDLGVLFPNEFASNVRITRAFTTTPVTGAADSIDHFRVQVLQTRTYVFQRGATGVPGSLNMTLRNDTGGVIFSTTTAIRTVTLTAGRTYTLSLGGWSTITPPTGSYTLTLRLGSSGENPTPLTSGPAPAFRLQLAALPPAPVAPVPVAALPVFLMGMPSAAGAGSVGSAAAPTATGVAPFLALPPGSLTGLGSARSAACGTKAAPRSRPRRSGCSCATRPPRSPRTAGCGPPCSTSPNRPEAATARRAPARRAAPKNRRPCCASCGGRPWTCCLA